MQNSYTIESNNDSTVSTVPHQHMQEVQNSSRATENTYLTPSRSQTYFADEKIQIPDTDNVILIQLIFISTNTSLCYSNLNVFLYRAYLVSKNYGHSQGLDF